MGRKLLVLLQFHGSTSRGRRGRIDHKYAAPCRNSYFHIVPCYTDTSQWIYLGFWHRLVHGYEVEVKDLCYFYTWKFEWCSVKKTKATTQWLLRTGVIHRYQSVFPVWLWSSSLFKPKKGMMLPPPLCLRGVMFPLISASCKTFSPSHETQTEHIKVFLCTKTWKSLKGGVWIL